MTGEAKEEEDRWWSQENEDNPTWRWEERNERTRGLSKRGGGKRRGPRTSRERNIRDYGRKEHALAQTLTGLKQRSAKLLAIAEPPRSASIDVAVDFKRDVRFYDSTLTTKTYDFRSPPRGQAENHRDNKEKKARAKRQQQRSKEMVKGKGSKWGSKGPKEIERRKCGSQERSDNLLWHYSPADTSMANGEATKDEVRDSPVSGSSKLPVSAEKRGLYCNQLVKRFPGRPSESSSFGYFPGKEAECG
ncbi:hypothetical protein WN55_08663 [Dufourea novaeangliae]|uniref:Uncharacterized protein n=1 Tax=Dufourea novaeangliae TaxID=178035 RepID=A0A154P1E6_DUFNO|nr:hypothetical protein WN55_08663 [Dufourea novaeangliae]